MTYEEKIEKLSRYQKQKMTLVALRADLDYWEAFSSSSACSDNNGGFTGTNNDKSPTENAANKALTLRQKIERNMVDILKERAWLTDLLNHLPEEDQGIMYLMYVSDLNIKETAEYLKKKPNTIEKKHRNIVKSLVI